MQAAGSPYQRHPSAYGNIWLRLLAGGAAWDPGGAEEPTAESAGLRRRKAL